MLYVEGFGGASSEQALNLNISGTPGQKEITDGATSEVAEVKKGVPFEKEALTITNNKLLEKPHNERLAYVTKTFISGNDVLEGLDKGNKINLEFKFSNKNKDLLRDTTLGQVLPYEIQRVISGGTEYNRSGLKGEFFDHHDNRLLIVNGTKIEIITRMKDKDFKSESENNQNKAGEYIKNNNLGQDSLSIVLEAISRDIEPGFALKVYSDKLSILNGVDRKTTIEDLFTEFDRQVGYVKEEYHNQKTGEYGLGMVFGLLMKVFSGDMDSVSGKLKELGYKEEELEKYKSKNIPSLLSESKKAEILLKAPLDLKKLVKKYFPPEEFKNALFVSYYESNFNANNINTENATPTIDRGYFQINSQHDEINGGEYYNSRVENIFDPEVNVRVAGELFKNRQNLKGEQDWGDWYAARDKVGLWA